MKNRFILSVFVFILVISSCVFAFGEDKVSENEAKKIAVDTVEKYFNLDVDDDFEIIVEESYEEGAWDIDISKIGKDSLGVEVCVESNKTVSSVFIYGNYEAKEETTKSEARKLADDLMNKMNPDKVKDTKCIEEENDYEFNFTYKRILNGIDFQNQKAFITVDKGMKKISEYRLDWNKDIDIPKVENVIDKSKATEIIQDNIEMRLMYIDTYDKDGNEKIKFVYLPYYKTASMVDAKDGELEYYIKNINRDMISKENYKESVSVKIPSYNLNEQETRTYATQKTKELLNKDITITSIEELNDSENKKTSQGEAWGVKFNYKDEEGNEANGKIVIDRNNKEIIHMDTDFDKWDDTDVKPKYTWEDGYERALNVIKDNCKTKAINIDTEMRKEDGNYKDTDGNIHYYNIGRYEFNRVVNGVTYKDNSISVYIDLNNNNVVSIEEDWDNSKKFEDKNKALDIEKVKQLYLDKNEVKLCYVDIYDQETNQTQIRLMYKISEKEDIEDIKYMDALTGEFLDYDGEIMKMN